MRSTIAFAAPLAGLALIVGGAAPARAQKAESVLTLKLIVEAATPADIGAEPELVQLRVGTKEFIEELAEAMEIELAGSAKLVVRRDLVEGDETDPDFTAEEPLLIVSGTEHALDPEDFRLISDLDLGDDFGDVDAPAAVKIRAEDDAVVARTRQRVRGLQTGNVDAPPDGNGQEISALGVEIAVEKLSRTREGGEALFFTKRTTDVAGSAAFNTELPNLPEGFPDQGVITGEIALSSEKEIDED
jgi:hypothetical protein